MPLYWRRDVERGLGALTEERPKPMVPLLGKPVLEHILMRLAKVGITEFILVVAYKAEVIKAYFGDGAPWGWKISYAAQPKPNGTGSALNAARDLTGSSPILASFGDILTDEANYRRLLAKYLVTPCAAAVGINYVEDVSAGSAVTLEGDRVVKVVEKPAPGTTDSHWNLAGVSVYGSEIWPTLAALKPSQRGEYELTDAIGLLIASGCAVQASEFTGFWSDIGTPAALAEAEKELEATLP